MLANMTTRLSILWCFLSTFRLVKVEFSTLGEKGRSAYVEAVNGGKGWLNQAEPYARFRIDPSMAAACSPTGSSTDDWVIEVAMVITTGSTLNIAL